MAATTRTCAMNKIMTSLKNEYPKSTKRGIKSRITVFYSKQNLKDSENIIQIYKDNWPIKIFHLKSVIFLVQHVQHFKTESPEF